MSDIDKKIVEFILNEENRDDVEYAYLYSIGEYGWQRLSSGNVVYISPPKPSAEECGRALRSMLSKIKDM
ncbi:hypothetical protein [Clostridium cuniculi]|uniref:hypothetical protein n=1 Tax=Clostridium cuniculi TaxID=2548455 RepID=UPI0010565749|nr:hypothetical protein [Clostridium cuniculi]